MSTHLTIGVHPWTRRHLTDELVSLAVARASEDQRVRASLGLGVAFGAGGSDLGGDVDVVKEALLRAVRDVSASDLSSRLAARVRSAERAAPVSPVATVRASATLAPDDVVVLRRHLEATLTGTTLRSRAGDVAVGPDEVARVQDLLAGDPVTVSSLGVDLARRLVVNGIAVIA